MPSNTDLHSHSTASDGTLSPVALLSHAAEQGIARFALTDHDTTAGLTAAGAQALELGIELVPGVELSVSWEGKILHVVGLYIDDTHPPLQAGMAILRDARDIRAREIGRRLASHGIEDTYTVARGLAQGEMITRAHYARALVANAQAKSPQDAFRRLLGRGCPGYVDSPGAGLAEAIGWITGAGGIAVLAHPLAYGLTRLWLPLVLTAFGEAGGRAIEVVYGNNTPAQNRKSAQLAREYGFLASLGADYHGPKLGGVRLGELPALPADLEPVWQHPARSLDVTK